MPRKFYNKPVFGFFNPFHTIDRDDAATALGPYRIGNETLAVVDIPDMHSLVLTNVGGVQQVFVDGAVAPVLTARKAMNSIAV